MINGFLARKLVPASTGCSGGGVQKRQRGGKDHNSHSLLFTLSLSPSANVFYAIRYTLAVLKTV
jgi:hypothetical protein